MKDTVRFASMALCAGLVLAGCGDDAASRAAAMGPVVRDSAGIEIVESAAPLWGDDQTWRVSEQPALEIGMLDGPEEYQLDQVRGAVRLRDGTLAVADGGSQRIRLYDPQGRHLRDLGGRGEGPGEFGSLSLVRPFRGDSIAAWDARQKRLTVFDATGGLGRVATVEGIAGWLVPAIGWLEDGSIVVTPGMDPMTMRALDPGPRRETRQYLRVDGAGGIDTLATTLGRDEHIYQEATSFGTRTVLFGRNAYAAVAGDEIVVGESGRFEVRVHGSDGALRRIFRVLGEPRPVTPAQLAAARERELEARRESRRQLAQQMGRAVEEDASETPARDTHPFFDAIQLDGAGHVWLREPVTDDDAPQRWQVLDPVGRWLGAVETPAGLRVTAIGHDYVLGVHRDHYDVEYVRVHGLRRTETR
jgi:hypothetical protein